MNPISSAIIFTTLILSQQILIGRTSRMGGFGKGGISGLTRAFDDRNAQLDTLGDPHGGLPEDATSLVKYCAQFIYSGLYIITFASVRWPLKLLVKAIVFTGALGYIRTNAMYCANPITMADFTTQAKLVNAHNERLAQIKEEWKKRIVYIVDKVPMDEKQKMGCCAFHEYKRKSIEEVPEAEEFIRGYFRGYYKMCEIVFCSEYEEGSAACESVKQVDEEPSRALTRSWHTLCWQIFALYL